jgi:hypothetical protein
MDVSGIPHNTEVMSLLPIGLPPHHSAPIPQAEMGHNKTCQTVITRVVHIQLDLTLQTEQRPPTREQPILRASAKLLMPPSPHDPNAAAEVTTTFPRP